MIIIDTMRKILILLLAIVLVFGQDEIRFRDGEMMREHH